MEIHSGAAHSIIRQSTFKEVMLKYNWEIMELYYQSEWWNQTELVYWGKNGALGWSVQNVKSLDYPDYVAEFPDVFGTFRGPPVRFPFKNNVNPVLLKTRKVPFTLKELDRCIVHPICGDYRSTAE